MLDLIIKNGSCFIEGNLVKTDIGITKNKISHIGNLENENSNKIYDAENLIVLPFLNAESKKLLPNSISISFFLPRSLVLCPIDGINSSIRKTFPRCSCFR